MNLGIGLGLTNYLRVPTVALDPDAAIAALFESGEEGAWYDPSDSTTVFQDANGTTAAGVGDPVGLILDKSKGLVLGSELRQDGTISTTGSPTLAVYDTATGQGTAERTDGTNSSGVKIPATTGKRYKIDIERTGGTGSLYIRQDSVTGTLITGAITSRTVFHLTISSGTGFFIANGTNSSSTDFTLHSIRELPGNHATQTTSAARPVLQSSGGLYYLDFDGVDDYMAGPTFAPALAQPNTIGIALKQDALYSAGFSYGFFFDGLISTERHNLYANNGFVKVFAGTEQTIQAQDLNDHVFTLHYNALASEARVDGSSVLSSVDFGSQPWGGLYLGSLFPAASPPASLQPNARIYSFVGVNRTLTAGEISDLESYLADKSGFTAPTITGVPTITVS